MDIGEDAERIPLRVLYISPSPLPTVQGTDGLFTEIGYLREFFGGDMISLSPARSLPPLIPVNLYGMHQIRTLKRYNKKVDIFHLFFPYIVNFRVLRYLSKPIIYTIISGMDEKCLPRSGPPCTLVVSSSPEADILRSRGFLDVHVIRPGIDHSQIQVMPPTEPDSEFVLLTGSAPWIKSQFDTKGFDLLLKVLTRLPRMRLICLWRCTLYREWFDRIQSFGLTDRVEIIQKKTDISKILSRCHAAVVLSSEYGHVKSYPNSLMEALAAGRPVLVSRSNPMSYYVEDNGCGKVIEDLCLEELINAIHEIMEDYSTFTRASLLAGRDLSAARMIDDYRHLYQNVTE
ncbi:MAG: glycosyltransferase family 4 protein [Methanotrichaceae archaeon]|nr:glycosyltransferase family 4 protein [Methanotrichaceae archaeon]